MKYTYKMLNIMYLIGLLYTRLIFDSIEITVLNVTIYYNQFVFMI